jgi:hypothetical protein
MGRTTGLVEIIDNDIGGVISSSSSSFCPKRNAIVSRFVDNS